MAAGEELLAREAVRLDGRAESFRRTQQLVQVRHDPFFGDRELRLQLGSEPERPYRLDDVVAHATVVRRAEDRQQARDVEAGGDDLVRDADPGAERICETEEDRESFERFVERVAAVADRIDVELGRQIRRVQRDIEVLESRLQRFQREARIGEGTEV